MSTFHFDITKIYENLIYLDKTAGDVVELLKSKELKIATAESCTGGLLSEIITSVAGASSVFELGVCSYSERIKTKILGVSTDTLDKYTVISEQTVLEMARGVKALSGADIAVAVTGMAGPATPDDIKPVGTVYVAFIFGNDEQTALVPIAKLDDIPNREKIRRLTACAVFMKLKDYLTELEG